MTAETGTPIQNRKLRIRRIGITGILMAFSFVVGLAVMAIIAVVLLLPIAGAGLTMGLVGVASAGAMATTNALYLGDSATRLTVLAQLKESFNSEPEHQYDLATVNWILPALRQCQSDSDPQVANLAVELIDYVNQHTTPSNVSTGKQPSQ